MVVSSIKRIMGKLTLIQHGIGQVDERPDTNFLLPLGDIREYSLLQPGERRYNPKIIEKRSCWSIVKSDIANNYNT